MSVTLTFNLEADFDRNGSYETALSSYTGKVSVSRGMGRDGQYKVGQMSFGVRNDSATFTPEYTSSSLFGQLEPGVPVRLRITHNSIDYSLFAGYMKRTVNKWQSGNVASADFTAQDLLAYLAGYSTTNVTVAERTTSAALTAIATNIGLSGGDYSFTGGQQTLPYHWSRNQDALSAMMDVVNSEMGGTLFADGDGVLQFQGRHERLGVTPDDTWGDGTTIYPSSIEYEVSDDNLISSVSIQANVFVLDDPNLVVFVASRNKDSTSFSLTAGETYEVELDYAQPITSLTTPVAQTDYQYNTASDGTGTDETANVDVTVTDLGAGFRLKLVNNSASTVYQMKFQLRGIPLNYVSDRPTFISELSIPGEKIDQSIAMLIPFADDDVQARNYSQGLLRTYRYPYPRLRLTIPWRDDDAAVAMLTAELGDLIAYTDRSVAVSRSSYVDDWWRIEALSHDVSANAGNTTQVTLVPSYLYFNLDAVLFDDFTRDNASGDLGTSLFGDVWANDSGFDIASNKAVANSGTLSIATLDLGTGITDQVVEVSTSNMTVGIAQAGVVLRYADANNHVRAYFDDQFNVIALVKVVAGTPTVLGDPAWTPTATGEIRAMVQGTRYRVWVDRVLVIDATDSDLASNTTVGIYANNASGVQFANFHARGLDS